MTTSPGKATPLAVVWALSGMLAATSWIDLRQAVHGSRQWVARLRWSASASGRSVRRAESKSPEVRGQVGGQVRARWQWKSASRHLRCTSSSRCSRMARARVRAGAGVALPCWSPQQKLGEVWWPEYLINRFDSQGDSPSESVSSSFESEVSETRSMEACASAGRVGRSGAAACCTSVGDSGAGGASGESLTRISAGPVLPTMGSAGPQARPGRGLPVSSLPPGLAFTSHVSRRRSIPEGKEGKVGE